MGVLDVILGRDANGHISKINLALIALLLWRMYRGSGRDAPVPAPDGGRAERPSQQQLPIPEGGTGEDRDGGFRELTEAMKRMPDFRRDGGAPGSGGLGDILGDILGGGRPGGRSTSEPGAPGGGLGDILGDILSGGHASGRDAQPGGSLGDILGDILGGGRPAARAVSGPQGDPFADMLRGGAGGGLGALLGAGLGGLLQQFEAAGYGEEAQSWVSRGDNRPISPSEVEDTFGADTIDTLSAQLGVSRGELLSGLAQVLPQAVDRMTPDGRLPTRDEMARWV